MVRVEEQSFVRALGKGGGSEGVTASQEILALPLGGSAVTVILSRYDRIWRVRGFSVDFWTHTTTTTSPVVKNGLSFDSGHYDHNLRYTFFKSLSFFTNSRRLFCATTRLIPRTANRHQELRSSFLLTDGKPLPLCQ